MTTTAERAAERFEPRDEKSHFDEGKGRVWGGMKTITGCNADVGAGELELGWEIGWGVYISSLLCRRGDP